MSFHDATYHSGRLTIRFSAELDNIDFVCIEVKKFLANMNIDKDFDLILSLREALLNAVVHGSKCDPDKTVFFEIRQEDFELIMQICDQGEGFDWRNIQENSPNAAHESGRGISIMRHYVEDLEYNDKGNELILRKRILSITGAE